MCRWLRRPWMLLFALLMTGAAQAAPPARSKSTAAPDTLVPGESSSPRVVEQEAGLTCASREPDRLVIRHPPIPEPLVLGQPDGRIKCDAGPVMAALREGRPVELENVVITGTLDLVAAVEPENVATIRKRDLMRNRDVRRLEDWLEERRREHRAPERLPRDVRFRPVAVPIVIRNSRLEAIKASAEDAVLFLQPVDLRGTRVMQSADFTGSIFVEPVRLDDTWFTGRGALFVRAHFDAGGDFTHARLGTDTRFDEATFGARFLSRDRRRGPLLRTPAIFTGAVFEKSTTFHDAVFKSRADFQKATFSGEADFGVVRFHEEADFSHARFAGLLDASNAVFEGPAVFSSVAFQKAATFRRAQFRQHADFSLANFADPASTFRDAEFGPSLLCRFPADLGEAQAAARRLGGMLDGTYDFGDARFADKDRTLARGCFNVHAAFALATALWAGLGAAVCLRARRPPLLACRPAPRGSPAIATVEELNPRRPDWKKVSPQQHLREQAFLITAYAALILGLAAQYHTNVLQTVDLYAVLWLPLLGFVVWIGGVIALGMAVFGYRLPEIALGRQQPGEDVSVGLGAPATRPHAWAASTGSTTSKGRATGSWSSSCGLSPRVCWAWPDRGAPAGLRWRAWSWSGSERATTGRSWRWPCPARRPGSSCRFS